MCVLKEENKNQVISFHVFYVCFYTNAKYTKVYTRYVKLGFC